MTRTRAALTHLAICIVVALVLLSLFWWVWYPSPLFQAVGGTHIFLLLLGIDVALGPLLTLVVFNPAKKSLKFDLAVIAAVQIAALVYGVFTLLSGRPVYIVNAGYRFDVVQASEVDYTEHKKLGKTVPLWGPKWTGFEKLPIGPENDRLMFGGFSYTGYPQVHVPIEKMRLETLLKAKGIDVLKTLNPGKEGEIDAWLTAKGLSANDVRFSPLKAPGQDMAVILDGKTAEVRGIAPFKPWE
jgi:hypothetical protein